jgi:hypothetical protein
MPTAEQSVREFKGDHISAKMFRPDGKPFALLVPAFNCSMEAGDTLLAVGPNGTGDFSAVNFTEAHIGFDVIVHAVDASTLRDGGFGYRPNLQGILHRSSIASIIDGQHCYLADPSPVSFSGATVDIGPDDTDTLLNCFLTGGSAEGKTRLVPTGCYLVQPGQIFVHNPGSLVWGGQGVRFNSMIRSNDPTSSEPVLRMGNGIIDGPHSWLVQDMFISKGYGPGPAVYMDRIQIGEMRNVAIGDLGINGVGIDTPQGHYIFGEIMFNKVSVGGGDGFGGTNMSTLKNSIGMKIHATSNVVLLNCNIEDVETGLIYIGELQATLTWTGGHIERTAWSIILGNCQPYIDVENLTGEVYLGNDVVNGFLRFSSNSTLWSNGSIIDCGFGNRIRRTSSTTLGGASGGVFATGVEFDGDEWLNVAGAIEDPTFLHDIADTWTAGGGATITTVPITFPGIKRGRGLAIVAGAGGGGFASRMIAVEEQTDYLLHVGLQTQWHQSYRIVVEDTGGVLWDSGEWTYPDALRDFNSFKVFRKRIPTGAGITSLTITLYAIEPNQLTICPLLLLSKSGIRFETHMLFAGTGGSTSGSGVDFTVFQNVNTGLAFSFNLDPHPDLRHYGRCFIRAVVTDNTDDALKTALIGVGGNANALGSGPHVKLRRGTDIEYIVPLMSFPQNSNIMFWSFSGIENTIQIKELGLYAINDDRTVVNRLRINGRDIDTLDRDGNITLPVTTNFADRDMRFISTAPVDGVAKNPNIISMGGIAFGPNQGTMVCLNSKPTGYPNWLQTSRLYDFTASASSNTVTIAPLGNHYESLTVPFTGDSNFIMESTASGLSVGTNYWFKFVGPFEYEIYNDPALTSRVTLGNGTGKCTSTPYAMFLQFATSRFGVGFSDATNANGTDPWAGDTNNANTTGMPPFCVVSGRNSSAVKEQITKSGIYTGYPIFPMYSGGGGIFYSAGDPHGGAMWDASYPPLGSICLRGDGKFSVRTGPIPPTDDGSGWTDITSASQFWTLLDVSTIQTAYRIKLLNSSYAANRPLTLNSSKELATDVTFDASWIADGSISNTEFQHLEGVTSAIQAQLNALDARIDALESGGFVTIAQHNAHDHFYTGDGSGTISDHTSTANPAL